MKAKLFDKTGKEKRELSLPKLFAGKIRKDIILKVFEAQKGLFMQATGAKKGAGAQYSASGIIKHRRHDWKSSYGKGISRIPRKILSRHGASFNWIGATVSGTRGGRRAHPPKSEKNLIKKINKKELRLAFSSALTASLDAKSLEEKYGKKVSSGAVFDKSITGLKTKDFLKSLKKVLGEHFELALKKKKVRAGIGKMRGRKYKSNAGLLFVIGDNEKMKRNRIDVVSAKELEIKDLAPNGEPGRLVCYTEEAIKDLEKRFG